MWCSLNLAVTSLHKIFHRLTELIKWIYCHSDNITLDKIDFPGSFTKWEKPAFIKK